MERSSDAKHASIVLELMNKQRHADSSNVELWVGVANLSAKGWIVEASYQYPWLKSDVTLTSARDKDVKRSVQAHRCLISLNKSFAKLIQERGANTYTYANLALIFGKHELPSFFKLEN